MRVRGRLDWKAGVTVSRGEAAKGWRLGLVEVWLKEPMWTRRGEGREGHCWLLAGERQGLGRYQNTCYNEHY